MTKRHFIALVDALRAIKPKGGTQTAMIYRCQWEIDRDAIADACQASNPRFDRQLWLAYIAGECGPSGGKIKTGTSPSL